MAILAECPLCHKKQSVKNKACKCGGDMDKFKRQKKRVRYWIDFKIPGGKKRREAVGFSIEEARDADGKRRTQKRENRIFDILPDSRMTFLELTVWYQDLDSVKELRACDRVQLGLKNFNKELGYKMVGSIQPVDLEKYQTKREKEGMAAQTIDMEVAFAKTMINKAFDNDLIDGRAIKAFRRVKKKLKRGANARKRTVTIGEYLRLVDASSDYFRPIIKTAFNTGMRGGEIRKMKWSYIDREAGFIRLPAEVTKEKKDKNIPINYHVKEVLLSVPKFQEHDFVFTHGKKPYRSGFGFSDAFLKICRKTDIPAGRKDPNGVIFHDIRRTVKTNMLNAGVDKTHRDIILGHSLLGMDVHYIAPDEETLRQAMKKYARWLDEQIAKAVAKVDQTVDQEVIKQP